MCNMYLTYTMYICVPCLSLLGDTRTIHLIAEITIQRLTEKKEQPPFVNKEKEV